MTLDPILSSLYFLLVSPTLQAASCNSIIEQIYAERKNYSNAIHTASWQTLTWFEAALGQSREKTEMTHFFYQWNDYHLFVIGQGSRLSDAAIRTLGKPTTTLTGHSTQYRWLCNNRASILTITDQNSDLINSIHYTVVKQDRENSTVYFAPGSIEMRPDKFSNQLTKTDWTESTLKKAIEAYNAHFKTQLQNQEEFEKNITEQFKQFYEGLQNCRAGIYRYILISPVSMAPIFPVSIIHDMKNNLCSLTTTYLAPGGKIEVNCPFGSFKKLPPLTNQQLTSAAKGNFLLFTSPMQVQSVFTGCRTTINGKNLTIYEDSAIPL